MASRVTIQFNHLPQIASNLEARAADVVGKSAMDIEDNWVANIAEAGLIDTGAYLLSVFAEEVSDTHWQISTNLADPPYPFYLEYGTTRGIRPYGVMTKAVEKVQPAFNEAMRQLVEMSAP